MSFSVDTYAAAKSYTDNSIAGGGISAGKNCVISSIAAIPATQQRPAGQRVTFQWTLDNGTVQTGTMDVYNGKDGEGIDRFYIDEHSHLIVVYDDGTSEDCGEITVTMGQSDWNEVDYQSNAFIKNKPMLGTASGMDIPEQGDAGNGQVVLGNDTRLSDARTPVAHTHTVSDISNLDLTDYIEKSQTAGFVKNDGTIDTTQYVSNVDGKADLTIVAPVEASTTSSRNYAAGDRFCLDKKLYKAKDVISIGDTIVVSGVSANAEETTIDEEIANNGGGGTGTVTSVKMNNGSPISPDANGVVDLGTVITSETQADWNESNSSDPAYIANKPTIPAAQVNADWEASSGVAEILNKPTIPAAQIQSDWEQSDNSSLDYIKNKPTIPAAQVNADWSASTGVAEILHKPTLGTAAAKDSTNAVTANSTDLVESGAVKTYVDGKVSSAYHHAGTKTVAELTSALLIAANDGNVYNITDAGTTTADFIEGAGKAIRIGDNVGVAKVDASTYKFDLLSGFIDTSNFIEKSSTSGLVKNDGTIDTDTFVKTSSTAGLLKNDGTVDPTSYVSDISGKADKVTGATNGHLAGLDSNGNLTDSGIDSDIFPSDASSSDKLAKMSDVPSVTGKADKVSGATNGNFAGLDANGNLMDSGHKHSDYLTSHQDISGKCDLTNIATVEASATASKPYVVGALLIYNGVLYAVTEAISIGGTIVTSGVSANVDPIKVDGAFIHNAGDETLTGTLNVENPSNDSYHSTLSYNGLSAENSFTISADGNINLTPSSGNNVNITATGSGGNVNISGQCFRLTSTGASEIETGSDLSVSAGGDIDIGTPTRVLIAKAYNSTTSSNTGGDLEVEGIVTVEGSDYAEKFAELEECPVCRFVTLDGERIRLAQPDDDYILGVTSEAPAIVGDMSNDGKPVGLIGKLWVEHDGTAKVNDYVECGKNGIAIEAIDYYDKKPKYRVMAVDGNRCKLLVK